MIQTCTEANLYRQAVMEKFKANEYRKTRRKRKRLHFSRNRVKQTALSAVSFDLT